MTELHVITKKRKPVEEYAGGSRKSPKPQIKACTNDGGLVLGIMQKLQPQSVDYATKYSGYRINTVKMNGEYHGPVAEALEKMEVVFIAEFIENGKHFPEDKEPRDIFAITLKRGSRQFSFKFGQSLNNNDEQNPTTPYDVLAAMTWYDPESFEDFCGNFGYDEDSRTAEKVYKAVCEEYKNLQTLFNSSEMEELSEIAQ